MIQYYNIYKTVITMMIIVKTIKNYLHRGPVLRYISLLKEPFYL